MYNLARLRGFPAKYPGSVSSHLRRLRRTTQEAAGGALFQHAVDELHLFTDDDEGELAVRCPPLSFQRVSAVIITA